MKRKEKEEDRDKDKDAHERERKENRESKEIVFFSPIPNMIQSYLCLACNTKLDCMCSSMSRCKSQETYSPQLY